jgi:hypothetical protein
MTLSPQAMLWDTVQAYSKHVRRTNDTSLPLFNRRTLQQHDLSNTRELLFKLVAWILILSSGLAMLGMLFRHILSGIFILGFAGNICNEGGVM